MFFIAFVIAIIIINIIVVKRPIFTILINLMVIVASYYLCDIGNLQYLPQGDYTFESGFTFFSLISLIFIIFMIVLTLLLKMKKRVFSLICGVFMLEFVAIGSMGTSEVIIYVEDFINYQLACFKTSLVCLLLQTNLFVYFINANRDCFNKKSEKFSGSKE